jgi:glycyl-tRNA synthetase beta chain
MTTRNLLVELFVEELPPKALKKLGEAFASTLADSLSAQGLATDASTVTPFASPRRLAAHVSAVSAQAADKSVSQKLMPVSVGLTATGEATPALLKKLASVGAGAADVPRLKRQMDGKAEALFFDSVVTGATLAQGLQRALDKALADLPIPKVMQYQLADGWTSVNFVRPAHGLVALYGDDVIPVQTLGLTAGRSTRGHRFEALVDPIVLKNADEYAPRLESDGAVIASFVARRDEIARQLQAAAAKQGLTPIHDDALLDEVTALVERPNVLTCQFEPAFLDVPQECLILTMKANQKYFPLLDAAGTLTNQFLVVSNIRPADASRVIEGNERVVRPRLADAKFFFDQDRKRTLESRVAGLDKVVYHGKLGTQGERTNRVRRIASWVASKIGCNVRDAERAALLAKADLLTDMVGEFPELQGVMGQYYAIHDGEAPDVARAIGAQYINKRADWDGATNLVGEALLLADRVETLVGIWGIGLKPTGDKDPFALRRHALTIISSFDLLTAFSVETASRLSLQALLSEALATFEPTLLQPNTVSEVEDFIYERYVNLLAPNFDVRAVHAVFAQRPPLHEVVKRIFAVRDFQQLPEAASLAAANKRVGNILKKVDTAATTFVDAALLTESAEIALSNALMEARPRADAAFDRGDYAASLQALAVLKEPVDAFFDSVMVNADDPELRANRLGLLATLHAAMNRVADLSKLAT